MLKYKPDLLFCPGGKLVPNMILAINESAVVVDIYNDTEDPDTIPLEGILAPGFINCHCHLELSHLINKVSPGGGLHNFISELVLERGNADPNTVKSAIEDNDSTMWANGIQAAGDICNDESTFSVKKKSKLTYYNFIEAFDLKPERTKVNFRKCEEIYNSHCNNHSLSITPHAPYSVTPELFKKITNHNGAIGNNLMSIHFMETESEKALYKNRSGELYELMAGLGIDYTWIRNEVKNAIDMVMPFMLGSRNLFVHNTFLDKQHIDLMDQNGLLKEGSFCLCPNANIYIERRLPDVELFRRENLNIVLGTDSLASNYNLSVIEEINTIIKHYPMIKLEEILKWATENGAAYFGWDGLGSFKKGKSPGGVLINKTSGEKYKAERVF